MEKIDDAADKMKDATDRAADRPDKSAGDRIKDEAQRRRRVRKDPPILVRLLALARRS